MRADFRTNEGTPPFEDTRRRHTKTTAKPCHFVNSEPKERLRRNEQHVSLSGRQTSITMSIIRTLAYPAPRAKPPQAVFTMRRVRRPVPKLRMWCVLSAYCAYVLSCACAERTLLFLPRHGLRTALTTAATHTTRSHGLRPHTRSDATHSGTSLDASAPLEVCHQAERRPRLCAGAGAAPGALPTNTNTTAKTKHTGNSTTQMMFHRTGGRRHQSWLGRDIWKADESLRAVLSRWDGTWNEKYKSVVEKGHCFLRTKEMEDVMQNSMQNSRYYVRNQRDEL